MILVLVSAVGSTANAFGRDGSRSGGGWRSMLVEEGSGGGRHGRGVGRPWPLVTPPRVPTYGWYDGPDEKISLGFSWKKLVGVLVFVFRFDEVMGTPHTILSDRVGCPLEGLPPAQPSPT